MPSAWTVAAQEVRPAAYTQPIAAAGAAPEMDAGASSNWYTDMALAGAAGRAVGGTGQLRTGDQRVRFIHPRQPAPKGGTRQAVECHGRRNQRNGSRIRAIAAHQVR